MKHWIIAALFVGGLLACQQQKKTESAADATSVSSSAGANEINIKDSLPVNPACGAMQELHYAGTLPAASCPGIVYTLTIYKQAFSGDGVYKLVQRYLQAENGEDRSFTTYGRLYTLRGDAVNPDATVYQLVPFEAGGELVNLLTVDGNLELLNKDFERAASGLDYTLTLQP